MLNWEMKFKRFCPAFKLLTYYGNTKERRAKRQGWSKPNSFHVCITSYTLILQDAKVFMGLAVVERCCGDGMLLTWSG